MAEALPLLTLVKSREVDERPVLGPTEHQLEVTLTMLCSFYSADDLVQFLSSEAFSNLARQGDPWIEFELGLYSCLLYTSPSPRDQRGSRMPSSA